MTHLDNKRKPAIGAQLQALRVVAAAPASALLQPKPLKQGKAGHRFRSEYPLIPKLFSTLTLLKEIMERQEQAIVFHTFQDSIDVMSARLNEAGVRHLCLDGRVGPIKRGRLAREFKRGSEGGIPILLASSECMAAGHNFPLCANGIHYSYPWALDKVIQSDDRFHRLNSPRDVNSYRVVAEGSTDPRMEAQAEEKSDAAELVLDGQLIDKQVEEITYAEMLQIAQREFRQDQTTINERERARAWPALRADLAAAARQWGGGRVLDRRMKQEPGTPNTEHRTLNFERSAEVIPFPEPVPVELADLPLFAAR